MGTRSGQSTLEYMLVVSVLVLALVAAAYVFVPAFGQGVSTMATDAGVVFTSAESTGANERR